MKLGLLGASGLIIGKFGRQMPRFFDVEGSVVVFAPQGSGKGVGVVVPNLLTYAGSKVGPYFAIQAVKLRPCHSLTGGDLSEERSFGSFVAVLRLLLD